MDDRQVPDQIATLTGLASGRKLFANDLTRYWYGVPEAAGNTQDTGPEIKPLPSGLGRGTKIEMGSQSIVQTTLDTAVSPCEGYTAAKCMA